MIVMKTDGICLRHRDQLRIGYLERGMDDKRRRALYRNVHEQILPTVWSEGFRVCPGRNETRGQQFRPNKRRREQSNRPSADGIIEKTGVDPECHRDIADYLRRHRSSHAGIVLQARRQGSQSQRGGTLERHLQQPFQTSQAGGVIDSGVRPERTSGCRRPIDGCQIVAKRIERQISLPDLRTPPALTTAPTGPAPRSRSPAPARSGTPGPRPGIR